MTRILLFVIGLILASLGFTWLAERPGSITIDWLGYQITTSALVGALAIVVLVAALILLWSLLRYLLSRPAAVANHIRERRRQHGFDALTRGLLAIGVGDRQLAHRYANIARRSLPQEPLTALLKAQAAQLKGDRVAAQQTFQAMIESAETELLGLRGLFLEAKRSNDTATAKSLAERAVARDPKLPWSLEALFDLQARAHDWNGALKTLAIARKNGIVNATQADRRRAVLLTAEARDLESTEPNKALSLATEATRLAPSLVPAAEIAGRILASKGESRLASRLIARTWKLAPHPDLAVIYAFAKPGEPPRERLKRVKYLASLTPGDIEGQIAVAVAAIDAHEWQEAEAALSPYLDSRPSARICALMARIEAGQGNKGREREWLARAVRAPRDRAWIADGYISDRWLPVSPITGAVDAFAWTAPVDAIGRGDETLLIAETPEPQPPASPALEQSAPAKALPAARSSDGSASEGDSATPKAEGQSGSALSMATKPVERPVPSMYVPPPVPDDPGVTPADTDESPASLERLRAAHIR